MPNKPFQLKTSSYKKADIEKDFYVELPTGKRIIVTKWAEFYDFEGGGVTVRWEIHPSSQEYVEELRKEFGDDVTDDLQEYIENDLTLLQLLIL